MEMIHLKISRGIGGNDRRLAHTPLKEVARETRICLGKLFGLSGGVQRGGENRLRRSAEDKQQRSC